ncbi:MAG: phage major capsid protein [Candidatus Eisenbacteria sp.]|nr:phage major capsid protein [Candidatus Eisenbacteria bacterium]
MDTWQTCSDRAGLIEKASKVMFKAAGEDRTRLTDTEKRDFDSLLRQADQMADEIDSGFRREADGIGMRPPRPFMRDDRSLEPTERIKRLLENLDEPMNEVPKPDPEGRAGDFSTYTTSANTRRGITSLEREKRTASAMFGRGAWSGGWQSFNEFFDALHGRIADPRVTRAMSEGIGSDGGFMVPTEYSDRMLDESLGNEIVRRYATIFPMGSDELRVPGFVLDHNSSGLYGGLVGYWKAEGSTLTESQPEPRKLTLRAKKLAILSKLSNELLEDMSARDQLEGVFINAMTWYFDEGFINGDGSGEPLGIIKSPCVYEQAKEGGQVAATLVWENVSQMWGRLTPASASRSSLVWLAHPTTLVQLLNMSKAVGTGGVPVFMPANGASGRPADTLMGRPLILTAHCSTLGTAGDLILADLSRYGIGLRRDVRLDRSGHAAFTSDEEYWRLIARVDGQPLDNRTTLLPDGTEVAPFVTLETRS